MPRQQLHAVLAGNGFGHALCACLHFFSHITAVALYFLVTYFLALGVLWKKMPDDLGTEAIFEDSDRSGGERAVDTTQERVAYREALERDVTPPLPDVEPEEVEHAASVQADAQLKKRTWLGTAVANQKWLQFVSKTIPIDKLSFDVNKEHGQTRGIDEAHVAALAQSLTERPPTDCVKVTVWDNHSGRRMYVLAGQHLTRAILKVKDNRQKQGMPIDKWMTHVYADVLKFETPLDDRRLIAGAQNASTKIFRVTSVSECLQNMWADSQAAGNIKTAQDMQDFILRHVEQAGLNVHEAGPVCAISSHCE